MVELRMRRYDNDPGIDLRADASWQAYVRRVNASLAVALPFRLSDELMVLCECGRRDCKEWVTLTNRDYRSVRRRPALHIVVDGHERAELDEVKRRQRTYTVIETRVGATTDSPLRVVVGD
jgi:hypothetical protein